MADDQTFLTIAEAAAFLRVSATSLRRWTNSGKLRSFRVGGRNERRFLREDLLAFMPSVDDRATVPPPAASADTRERHVCLLFHDPEEQWHLLRPYLLAQLRADAPMLYLHDSTLPERVMERLRAAGLAVDELLARGLLRILPPAQSYLLAGRFDPQRMLAFVESAILAGLAAGHERIFITGEMTWSLANAPGAERMMSYEALLNPLTEKYPAVTFVCQYDLQRFTAASVLDALQTHPSAQLASGLVAGFYR